MAKIRIHNKRKQDLIFYIVMLAYPVLQFAIFYIGVNFNSILMAFQYFSGSSGKIDHYTFFEGAKLFTNFATFFERFKSGSGTRGNIATIGKSGNSRKITCIFPADILSST